MSQVAQLRIDVVVENFMVCFDINGKDRLAEVFVNWKMSEWVLLMWK